MPDTTPATPATPSAPTTNPLAVYATAPDLREEHEDLVRTMSGLPLRERLVRLAALADRSTLNIPEAHRETDGKTVQSVISAALKLATHDHRHGTATGPMPPLPITAASPLGPLRAYIRQEYAAWLSITTTHPQERPLTPAATQRAALFQHHATAANAYPPARAAVSAVIREMPLGGALQVRTTDGTQAAVTRDDLHAMVYNNVGPRARAAAVTRLRHAVRVHVHHGEHPVYKLFEPRGMRPALYLGDLMALLNRWAAENAQATARSIYPAATAFVPAYGPDGIAGWTLLVPQAKGNGVRYGWADGRNGMSGTLWDHRVDASNDLTDHNRPWTAPQSGAVTTDQRSTPVPAADRPPAARRVPDDGEGQG